MTKSKKIIICNELYCTTKAGYNYKHASGPLYCKHHKLYIMCYKYNKRCINGECLKTARYPKEGGSKKYCKNHYITTDDVILNFNDYKPISDIKREEFIYYF